MPATVAIVGRPNVGKSTLFNRLVGRREALVDDAPGLTRDRREGAASLAGSEFTLIDTAGLEEADDGTLEQRMFEQTARAVGDADVVVFVVDARAGVTPLDEHFAAWLRRAGKPVVMVANKAEGRGGDAGVTEAFGLGYGDPVPVSAEHGDGMADLYTALAPFIDDEAGPGDPDAGEDSSDEEAFDARPMRLAIVGRPNVGKSTLVNQLIGEERVLTGPEPGVTRDAIAIEWAFEGRDIALIDTAGMRRKAKVTARLEKLSIDDTLRAIRFAHVVILVIDASEVDPVAGGLHKQDLTIARMVEEEGRALVVAANKWDVVDDRARVRARIEGALGDSLAQVRGVPFVTIAAREGSNLKKLMRAAVGIEIRWNARVPTGGLNRWLFGMTERHPPPMAKGRRLRLRYLTQVNTRPPTFALWVSRPVELPGSYRRYLINGLRDAFDLEGVPIRLMMRKGKNPYGKD